MRVRSPRIVQHDDHRRRWWLFAALLLLLAAMWQVFEFGKRRGGYDASKVLAERMQLAQKMAGLEKKLDEARAETARYRRQAQIERQASRQLQEELMRQQERVSSLQAEVQMLKGLVSSGAGTLYVRDLKVEPAGEAARYRYRFTLVQVKEDVELTRGKLLMKLSGTLGKRRQKLDRSQFSPDGEKAVKLEFHNYQDVEGEIRLPEGFVPQELRIEFLPRNKQLKKLQVVFPWPKTEQGEKRRGTKADATKQ